MELTLIEHFYLNLLVKDRPQMIANTLSWSEMPGITALKELHQEHLQQKLGKKISSLVRMDMHTDPDVLANTHINKLLGLPSGGNTKKERTINYRVIELCDSTESLL